jgi:lauroyl/myristoyl acyltransferase
LIRKEDDRFKLIFEEPITPPETDCGVEQVRDLVYKYLSVIEEYVRKYPAQWFMFQEVWNGAANSGPHTII